MSGPRPDEISAALRRLLIRELGEGADLPERAPLAEHLDSLQLMTLAVAVEDHFEVCLEPEDEERASTLHALAAVLSEKLRG